MQISIIIPTYNEAESLPLLLAHLQRHRNRSVCEIIVVDGGSTDETLTIAGQYGTNPVTSPQKGRAAQMHFATTVATGDLFYFVHADTIPPSTFAHDILKAVSEGYDLGRYRTKFQSTKWLLKLNAWFTRFDWFICYGGDQTLFITRQLYTASGGFDTSIGIMEEYEFVPRARKNKRYIIFSQPTLVSARKYIGRSWWQVQMANRKAVGMFKKGVQPDVIRETYLRMLKA